MSTVIRIAYIDGLVVGPDWFCKSSIHVPLGLSLARRYHQRSDQPNVPLQTKPPVSASGPLSSQGQG